MNHKASYKLQKKAAIQILALVLFAVIGTLVLVRSKAATSVASVEPESGTVSSASLVQSDSTASGGKVIQFTKPPVVTPSAYPGASNTGPAAAGCANPNNLPDYTGPEVIRTDGTTITCMDINTDIIICANNVTLRGNRIHFAEAPDQPGILAVGHRYSCDNHSNATIVNNEIRGEGSTTAQASGTGVWLSGDGVTFTGNNLYWIADDGISFEGTNMIISNNWMHDFVHRDKVHFDGIELDHDSTVKVTIQHNYFDMWVTNSAGEPADMNHVINTGANVPNITVNDNLIAGGGYSVSGGAAYTNNKFSTIHSIDCGRVSVDDAGGPGNYITAGTPWTNNTWYDGPNAGQQITKPSPGG